MNIEFDERLNEAVENALTRSELLKKWARTDGNSREIHELQKLKDARMYWLMKVMREINGQLPAVLAHPTIRKRLAKTFANSVPREKALLLHHTPAESAGIFPSMLFLVLEAPGPTPFVWLFTSTLDSSKFSKLELEQLREITETSFWSFWEFPLIAFSTAIGLARAIVLRSAAEIEVQ